MNVTPRYARLRAPHSRDVIGWENIELISDRPFTTMLAELKRLKEEYPDRILIASIMEEYNKNAFEEIIGRLEEVGVVSPSTVVVSELLLVPLGCACTIWSTHR